MLDINQLRTDIDATAARLADRGFKLDVDHFRELEAQRKASQMQTQELQAKRNSLSKQIGVAKEKGEDTAPIMAEVAGLGDELKKHEDALADIQSNLDGC